MVGVRARNPDKKQIAIIWILLCKYLPPIFIIGCIVMSRINFPIWNVSYKNKFVITFCEIDIPRSIVCLCNSGI